MSLYGIVTTAILCFIAAILSTAANSYFIDLEIWQNGAVSGRREVV